MDGGVTTSLEALLRLKARARGFSLLPRQPVGSLLAGRHHSRLRGRGLDFDELRRYHAGDDVRSIDWKATARLRTPQVRVYTEERDRPVLLVVDQRRSMFFGSRRAMKSVAAAELAALAAWRALDAGDRVGGIVFNDDGRVELQPRRSRSAVLQLLHALVRDNQALARPGALAEAPRGEAPLADALQAALRLARHDRLVVLISDLAGAGERVQRLATQIQAHNDLLVAAVYDPLGASLQTAPGMFVLGAAQRFELPTGERFQDAFRQEFETLLAHWTGIFRMLRIPILPITTEVPVIEQLREQFGPAHAKAA